jgi:hypothetical protein
MAHGPSVIIFGFRITSFGSVQPSAAHSLSDEQPTTDRHWCCSLRYDDIATTTTRFTESKRTILSSQPATCHPAKLTVTGSARHATTPGLPTHSRDYAQSAPANVGTSGKILWLIALPSVGVLAISLKPFPPNDISEHNKALRGYC